jgi:hypothetical protein
MSSINRIQKQLVVKFVAVQEILKHDPLEKVSSLNRCHGLVIRPNFEHIMQINVSQL